MRQPGHDPQQERGRGRVDAGEQCPRPGRDREVEAVEHRRAGHGSREARDLDGGGPETASGRR
jgi:hypothetical protein